jgi:hypothetical protein
VTGPFYFSSLFFSLVFDVMLVQRLGVIDIFLILIYFIL